MVFVSVAPVAAAAQTRDRLVAAQYDHLLAQLMSALEPLNVALSKSYHLLRELGEGGMATVYLARDIHVGDTLYFVMPLVEGDGARSPARGTSRGATVMSSCAS